MAASGRLHTTTRPPSNLNAAPTPHPRADPTPCARREPRPAPGVACTAPSADAQLPPRLEGSISPSTPVGIGSQDYWELLASPEHAFSRARSASEAGVLRRKGRLKEQDKLIEFILKMHETHTCSEACHKFERWVAEHRQDPQRSILKTLVPSVGQFFTELPLTTALVQYDEYFSLSRRRYVHPNFAEVRHLLNIAQIHACADSLRLITFDADGTLYADGCHIEQDNQMIGQIIALLSAKVRVAIVTAAGYPDQPEMFERRLQGLVDAFKTLDLPARVTDRFYVMGGECNYLLKYDRETEGLAFIPRDKWMSPDMLAWDETEVDGLLDEAQQLLEEAAARLRLPVSIIRKERAVGAVPSTAVVYEVLEDMAISVQQQLVSHLPFCAFNGGGDVFVDVGNKSLGLEALMKYVGVQGADAIHVGDRFTVSGNDSATRDCCCILWVANPDETGFFVRLLLSDMRNSRLNRAVGTARSSVDRSDDETTPLRP